jgi:hypothetical protein
MGTRIRQACLIATTVAIVLGLTRIELAAQPVSSSFLHLASQPGDPIGEGLVQTFTLTNAAISSFYNGTDIFFNVAPAVGGVYTLQLSAVPGLPLVPGTYTNAARAPFRSFDQPGIDISHNSTACNTLAGAFVVTEAQYGPFGPNGYYRVLLFSATFQLSCDGAPALAGEVRFEEQPDTTAPILVLPPDITSEASGTSGGVVYFYAYALDDRDTFPPVTCDPNSGALFAIGTTVVTCVAIDSAGNRSSGSFNVTVLPPLELGVDISTVGWVDPKNGVAVLQGTVYCSRDALVFVSGQLTQEIAQRATLSGPFSFPVQCVAQSSWTVTIGSANGRYKAGKARGAANAVSCLFSCQFAQAENAVVLKAGGPQKNQP